MALTCTLRVWRRRRVGRAAGGPVVLGLSAVVSGDLKLAADGGAAYSKLR